MIGSRMRAVVAPLALGCALLLGWVLTAKIGQMPRFVLPTPADVLDALHLQLSSRSFWRSLCVTLFEAFGGSTLGAAVAIPLAVAIHESRWFSAATQPFLGATQAIPAIVLAPLLVLWVGYGLVPVMVLCALMVFFPILVATVLGLRHVDPELVAAGRMDGAGTLSLLRHIEGPLSLPSTLAGLRNGFTLSITGAVVGEMVMGGSGLGELLTIQRDRLDTPGMFATIGVLCLVAATIYSIIRWLEHRISFTDAAVD